MTTVQFNRSAPRTTALEASDEIADDLHPFLRRYKDGRVERLVTNTVVPASETPGANGVATRDVVIDPSTGVSARLFLSTTRRRRTTRLPVIVYFHGGGFCTGSAFSKLFHRYASSLCARAGALVVSVDYRLAPEHPVPACFDDAWTALRWVTSSSDDPWLADHADHARVFVAGDSAGANIAHNVVARAAAPDGDDIDIEGMILLQPFFWGAERLPLETTADDDLQQHEGRKLFVPEKLDTFWPFLTAGAAGNDDPRLDPPAEVVEALPCRRALVAVASRDLARHRGRRYASWLRSGGQWCREVTLVESEGEDHAFHLYRPTRATAVELMDSVVEFVQHDTTKTTPPIITAAVLDLPRRDVLHDDPLANLHAPRKAAWGWDTSAYIGSGNKAVLRVAPRLSMVARRNTLVLRGPGKASVPRFGLMMRRSPAMKIL